MMSTRVAYGQALADLGAKKSFLVLDADLSKATRTVEFAEKFPDRFYNMGISECDMMSTAAGIASCGTLVVASTFAVFAAGRAFEQIRNSIAYTNLNVKVVASHGGVLIGEDGGSHQSIEDVALMRALPNMTVVAPADGIETRAALAAIMEYTGPVYMRLGRFDVPTVYEGDCDFKIGKGNRLIEGSDVSIFAYGDMVWEAMNAAKALEREGISASVIDMHTIKPLDTELVVEEARRTGAIVTAEDHNIIGGLGSAVCEVLSEKCPVKCCRVGVKDTFGRSGSRVELAEAYGLNSKSIVVSAKKAIESKEAKQR